jgi:hypothetical protein
MPVTSISSLVAICVSLDSQSDVVKILPQQSIQLRSR